MRLAALVAALWLLWQPVVHATDAFLEIREENWIEAIQISQVDSDVLYAIALAESGTSFDGLREYGPWPWVMNVNTRAKFYSSRESARKALRQYVEDGNDKIAVGMWQIYLAYNGHFVEDPVDLIDPVVNLYTAAMVLKGCGKQYQSTRDVLSCYHSGDVDEAGIAYAARVIGLAEKWGRPFRMNTQGLNIRFALRDAMAGAPEPVQMEVVRSEDPGAVLEQLGETSATIEPTRPATSASVVRVAALSAGLRTHSHSEFLAHMASKKETVWTNRVVVVE